jgi:hypothetical protein
VGPTKFGQTDGNTHFTGLCSVASINLTSVIGEVWRQRLVLSIGLTEWFPPENGDRIHSPKHCVKENAMDNVQNCGSYTHLNKGTFRHVTPCSSSRVNIQFERSRRFHFQDEE